MAAERKGELRIGLTISGAVALGAYEGGVLAALLAGVQKVSEETPGAVRIDAMAGASAGSMTALLAARTLVAGLDPIEVMYEAWVTTPQLSKLRDGKASPLSVDETGEHAARLLAREGFPRRRQRAPVRLHMALGCLRGLNYRIGRLAGPPIEATTYLDWAEWDIDETRGVEWYTAPGGPVDAALASGAHAAAFPPRGLERTAAEEVYRRHGIENFPPSKFLWYTDGGTIDNEPLGRALELTAELDSEGRDPLASGQRLHLMITPDPARPPPREDDRWSMRSPSPTWTMTGLRALKLSRTQRLYDDLRQVEKTNSRISWTRQLEETLLAIIGGERQDAEQALREVSTSIGEQKTALTTPAALRQAPDAQGSELADALRQAFDAATGLAGKREVAVSVISPLLLPEVANGSKTSRELLAGEFLGHFGGFLNQSLRENDFALGYRSMLYWLQEHEGLRRHGLEAGLSEKAGAGAEAARGRWFETAGRSWVDSLGSTSLDRRPLGEKLQLLKLALRAARIAFRQVRHGAA